MTGSGEKKSVAAAPSGAEPIGTELHASEWAVSKLAQMAKLIDDVHSHLISQSAELQLTRWRLELTTAALDRIEGQGAADRLIESALVDALTEATASSASSADAPSVRRP